MGGGHSVREDSSVTADIRYARNGGVAIAYQLVGDGETDLAYVPDFVSNLVYGWESWHWRDFYEQLAQSFRLILFDKRGTGLSDHGGQFAALETRMEDLHAVLDTDGFVKHSPSGVARRLLDGRVVRRHVSGADARAHPLSPHRLRT